MFKHMHLFLFIFAVNYQSNVVKKKKKKGARFSIQ